MPLSIALILFISLLLNIYLLIGKFFPRDLEAEKSRHQRFYFNRNILNSAQYYRNKGLGTYSAAEYAFNSHKRDFSNEDFKQILGTSSEQNFINKIASQLT